MKVYIACVRPREKDVPPSGPAWAPDTHDVWFSSKRGDFLMENIEQAQRDLDMLRIVHIRVGEHYCQLELEEEDGTFAIVCKEHPEPPAKP
jgi:hypothetical protein